jgi:hypothetical protein
MAVADLRAELDAAPPIAFCDNCSLVGKSSTDTKLKLVSPFPFPLSLNPHNTVAVVKLQRGEK